MCDDGHGWQKPVITEKVAEVVERNDYVIWQKIPVPRNYSWSARQDPDSWQPARFPPRLRVVKSDAES